MDVISFGTDGWRSTLDEFTVPRVKMVGQAVATYLRDAGETATVAIGYDAREGSETFADALADVLTDNGFDVVLPERDCPTPVIAWTVRHRDLAGGLMITASHNPPEYNGVKFIPAGGAPALPDVTDDLETNLAEPKSPDVEPGTASEEALTEAYLDNAAERIDGSLDGLTVAYDAMHGSGRGVTDELLVRCGADVERLRCNRDPEFGGSSPEPSAEKLDALVDRVENGAADLGVANDGDADRLGIVTPERGCLNANLLFAVLYEHLLETDEPGPAVRTVSTSSLIDRIAEDHGQSVAETQVGFKWVAQAMADHDALMGGEESGGFAVGDHVRNKDGVFLAGLMAGAAASKPIDDRVDAIEDRYGSIHQDKVSVDCPDSEKQRVLSDLADELPDTVAGSAVESVNDVDGFKIFLADDSWLLIRPSGTEPKLRVYAEAGSDERVAELLAAGTDLVEPLV